MAYAEYADYCGLYRGELLGELQFGVYAERAGEYLELLTYGRCADVAGERETRAVKLACCAVADELYRQQTEPELTSHSVGQWSRSYAPQKSRDRRIADAARLYLRGTGLLWRGWRFDGCKR